MATVMGTVMPGGVLGEALEEEHQPSTVSRDFSGTVQSVGTS